MTHELVMSASSAPGPPEWVEIVEPRTRDHMFANLTTGECLWEPPPGVRVKRANEGQWWELFDPKTSRFYYYNASSQKTVWHRPPNCDIIPLAKLQKLKQNTSVPQHQLQQVSDDAAEGEGNDDGGDEADVSDNTDSQSVHHKSRRKSSGTNTKSTQSDSDAVSLDRMLPKATVKSTSMTRSQTSPVESSPSVKRKSTRHPHNHHHHHHHHHSHRHALQQGQRPLPMPRGIAVSGIFTRQKSEDPQQQHLTGTVDSQSSGSGSGISRSISFTGKKQPQQQQQHRLVGIAGRGGGGGGTCPDVTYDKCFGPPPVWPSTVNAPSASGGGRRSVESTPQSSRRKAANTVPDDPNVENGHHPPPNPLRGVRVPMSPEIKRPQPKPRLSLLQNRQDRPGKPESTNKLSTSDSVKDVKDLVADGTDLMRDMNLNDDDEVEDPLDAVVGAFPPKARHSIAMGTQPISAAATKYGEEASSSGSGYLRKNQVVKTSSFNRHQNSSPHTSANNNGNGAQRLPGQTRPAARGSAIQSVKLTQFVTDQARKTRDWKQQTSSGGGGVGGGDSDVSSIISEDDLSCRNLPEHSDYNPSDSDDDDDDLSGGGRRYVEGIYEVGSNRWLPPSDPAPPIPPHQTASPYAPPSSTASTTSFDAISQDFEKRLDSYSPRERAAANSYGGDHGVSPYSVSTTLPRNGVGGAVHRQANSMQHHHHMTHHHSPNFGVQQPQTDQQFPQPYGVITHPSLNRGRGGKANSIVMGDIPSHLYNNSAAGGYNQPPPPPPPSDVSDGGSLQRPRTSMANQRQAAGHGHHQQQPPLSSGMPTGDRHSKIGSSRSSLTTSTRDLAQYYESSMHQQKKGLLRRPMTVDEIMSWTDQPLAKPLTSDANKSAKKEALEVFRLIQVYMKDRKTKDKEATITSLAQDIIEVGYNKDMLRDEIYVQLCKQTNGNPNLESLRRGWELLALCLGFFPPSTRFENVLKDYIQQHSMIDDIVFAIPVTLHGEEKQIGWHLKKYAIKCFKRLQRIGTSGHLKPKKPSKEEIEASRWQIIFPSQFGNTLAETMENQRARFPNEPRQLPWILTELGQKILELKGHATEGIFRVPADFDDVCRHKWLLDQWDVGKITDCHTAASLFKQWLRELYEPLVPDKVYDDAIVLGQQLEDIKDYDNHKPGEMVRDFVVSRMMPYELNYLTLLYLIRYLQNFISPEIVARTKMDEANLATIFAPNILRCPSNDAIVMIQNAAKESAFVKNLIKWLDTSDISGVI